MTNKGIKRVVSFKAYSHREYNEQVRVFEWAKVYEKKYPCLKYLNASQNGLMANTKAMAVRAKKSGLKKGYPDLFLPYPKHDKYYSGLFIELKRNLFLKEKKVYPSKEQREWLNYLNSVGYKAIVCYGADQAIQAIKEYLD